MKSESLISDLVHPVILSTPLFCLSLRALTAPSAVKSLLFVLCGEIVSHNTGIPNRRTSDSSSRRRNGNEGAMKKSFCMYDGS